MNLLERFQKLAPGHMMTIAGAGYQDGIPAKEADAGWPFGIVRLPPNQPHGGDLIVADYQGQRIWRIDGDGILHTFAGDGIPGWTGDRGPASEARMNYPHDLCLDYEGNVYVNDQNCSVFRRIDGRTGIITHVAGSGKVGRGGDGGPAVEAETDTTCGIAVARNGDIFIAGEWSNNVRRIDARTGIIERFAGQDARHYPSESGNSRPAGGQWCSFQGYHGDGGPAFDAAFWHPEHLAFDSKGDLYVCDNSNDRIRKIDMQTGIITTVLGNGQRASNGDGGPATEASTLMPDALCFDVHDNLYVGEKYGFRVRKVDGATGIVTTVLGGTSVHDGDVATNAFLNGVEGMDIGPDGHIYLADRWNQRIRAIDPVTGIIRGVAGNGARAYGGDGGPANDAYLGNPSHVAVDSLGRVTIADNRHSHVRRVGDDGVITTIAGTGQQWDKGDGGPAVSACFDHLEALVYADNGNLYISDTAVGRIRRVEAATGITTTVAGIGLPGYTGDGGPATEARIGSPSELALAAGGGVLYFSDMTEHVIRKVDLTSGLIVTVVGTGQPGYSPDGTPAVEAQISSPRSIALAPSSGDLYFSDMGNNRVRRVNANGRLETVVGNGEHGNAADDTPATSAPFNEPHGICFFDSHILLVSDFYNNQVKAVRIS